MKNLLLLFFICSTSFLSAQIQTPVILQQDTSTNITNPGLWLQAEGNYELVSSNQIYGLVLITMDSNFSVLSEQGAYIASTVGTVKRVDDGGLIVSGYKVFPGPGYNSAVSATKLDATGASQWQTFSSYLDFNSIGGYSFTDGEENILLIGRRYVPGQYYAITLTKIKSDGELVRDRQYIASDNGIVLGIGGTVLSNDDLLLLNLNFSLEAPIWLLRTNSDGDSLSSQYFGYENDYPLALLPTTDDQLMLVADGKDSTNTKAFCKAWKLDESGQVLWERSYFYADDEADWRNINPYQARATKDGGCVVFAGVFGKPTDSTTYNALYLLKIGPDGEKQWDLTIDDPDIQVPGDVLPLPEGGYLISARHEHYDGPTPIAFTYFARLSDDGIVATSRQAELSALVVSLSPNPFEDFLSGSFVMKTAGEYSLRIFDLQGRIVQSQRIQGQSGTNRFQLATAELPAASYVLRISSPAGEWSGKVVKR